MSLKFLFKVKIKIYNLKFKTYEKDVYIFIIIVINEFISNFYNTLTR